MAGYGGPGGPAAAAPPRGGLNALARPEGAGRLGRDRRAYIGLDVGSASVNAVAVDVAGRVVGTPVYRLLSGSGSVVEAVRAAVQDLTGSLPRGQEVSGAGTTGSGRQLNGHLVGADITSTEIFAHAVGICHLAAAGLLGSERPRTVMEIGGQDAKVISFDAAGHPSHFNMNSICSAGTGEFLQQIADDAGIPLAQLGPTALRSTEPAAVDATCTVFARRDFRHLTQKGVPLPDRLMGIALALVDNYILNVLGTQQLVPPVVFQGGVASNSAVVAAFERRLQTPIIVPPHHRVLGAFGMALIARDHALGRDDFSSAFKPDLLQRGFATRLRYCRGCANACEVAQSVETSNGQSRVVDTMGGRCERCHDGSNLSPAPPPADEFSLRVRRSAPAGARSDRQHSPARPALGRWFAGIDGGSRGTKWALVQAAPGGPEVHAVGALDTGGDAIAAILGAVAAIGDALPTGCQLAGLGTTGSAGELARDMVSARDRRTSDYRSTEILSHHAWASHLLPGVGTVMDIGGNDSKLISVSPGGLDFAMNDKCAAGTGSFLESMARRFEVPLDCYGQLALESMSPARVAGRCAVFGESDLVHKSRSGYPVRDLLMGAALSVARTYLSDVAGGFVIRTPVVAQGGAFLNQAVSAAFRQLLGLNDQEFRVHPDPRQVLGAGALGAALLSQRQYERGYDTAFKGFGRVLSARFETRTATCSGGACGRVCHGLVLLVEDGVSVAGYRSVDCPLGLFGGMMDPDTLKESQRLARSVAAS